MYEGAVVSFFPLILIAQQPRSFGEERRGEDKLQDWFMWAPVAYFSVTRDGIIERANAAAAEMLGYELEDLMGLPVLQLYVDSPDGTAKAEGLFQQFLRGEEIHGEEMEMRRLDGSTVWVSVDVRPILDSEGMVVASRSIAVDITDARAALSDLGVTGTRLQQVLDACPLSLMAVDTDLNVQFWNPAAEQLFGWRAEEVKGRRIPAIPEEARSEADLIVEDLVWTGVVTGRHLVRLRKDGSKVRIRLSAAAMRDSEADVTGFTGIQEEIESLETDPWEALSPRERQVLQLVARGHTNSEIAGQLSIGKRTVETHRANMMEKMGFKTMADLLRYAIWRGLVPERG